MTKPCKRGIVEFVPSMLNCAAAALIAMCPAAAIAPSAAADPKPGNQSAAATIDDLTNQGYDVQINWVSGISSRPLSECRVLAVHNPSSSAAPPTTFTTVYVDVSCPNNDDGGFTFGSGLAIG